MSASESIGASAVKVAAVATGAAMSGMQTVTQSVGVTGQDAIWFVTFLYGTLQVYKCLPWAIYQTAALWKAVVKRDSRALKAIARIEEQASDGSK